MTGPIITPPHPNLFLDRAMTAGELIDAVRYEGMFAFDPRDATTVVVLESVGLVMVGEIKGEPVVVNTMDDPVEAR